MPTRERNLFVGMSIAGATLLAALISAALTANTRSHALELVAASLFLASFVANAAAVILSFAALANGPPSVRVAVLKWFALLIPSAFLIGHAIPILFNITFSIALTLVPLRWLLHQEPQERSNQNAP